MEQITITEGDISFLWSPDGKSIAYATRVGTSASLKLKSLGVDRLETTLKTFTTDSLSLDSWSPDGDWILFVSNTLGNDDIWRYSFKDKEVVPYLNTEANERTPVFSADGKWMAYASNERGSFQVYVMPFIEEGEKRKISIGSGSHPKWANAGDRLYYFYDAKIMSIAVSTAPNFRILGQPEPEYEGPEFVDYDVHPDGTRLLMVKKSGEYEDRKQIRIVLNWFSELDRLKGRGKR